MVIFLFNGISTLNGLFQAKISFVSICVMTIITIFNLLFHFFKFKLLFFLSIIICLPI